MQHDPTAASQEQLLFEEQLAHEYGVVLPRPPEGVAEDADVDDVVYPYAYALESVVT